MHSWKLAKTWGGKCAKIELWWYWLAFPEKLKLQPDYSVHKWGPMDFISDRQKNESFFYCFFLSYEWSWISFNVYYPFTFINYVFYSFFSLIYLFHLEVILVLNRLRANSIIFFCKHLACYLSSYWIIYFFPTDVKYQLHYTLGYFYISFRYVLNLYLNPVSFYYFLMQKLF